MKKLSSVEVFHNSRWARYKGEIFSHIFALANEYDLEVSFNQIAHTTRQRQSISSPDLSSHRYPHRIFFNGCYEDAPRIPLFRELFRSVYQSKASLIVLPGYHRPEYWLMLLAARLSGKRCAVFCDSTLADNKPSKLKSFLKRLFFGFCDGFFAYGTRSRDLLIQHGVQASQVFYPCLAAFLPSGYNEDEVIQAKAGLRKRSLNFIFVGRLSKEKSIDVLIQAFAKLSVDLPYAKLTLIGDGPERTALKELSALLGIVDRVDFHGPVDSLQIGAHYLASDALVLPSKSEPWGLVANEALHYGTPLVVSDSCGCAPELVDYGKTGFIFRTGSIDDLTEKLRAMRRILEIPRDVVAGLCLNKASLFSAEAAAKNILAGCAALIKSRES